MSVPTLDEHAQAWTEEEFRALPETVWPRLELLDGALLVSPAPRMSHQRFSRALANAMDAAVPEDWEVLEGINVRLATGRIVIPDLVVVREIGEGVVTDAADVVLVAEIVSPSTGSQDRLLKPALYAVAGVPCYLRVEQQPELVVHVATLEAGEYVEYGVARAGEPLRLPAPFATAVVPTVRD